MKIVVFCSCSGALLHEVIVLPDCTDHFGVCVIEDCGRSFSDGSTHEARPSPVCDCHFVKSPPQIAEPPSSDDGET
jgi:hypothetical protein